MPFSQSYEKLRNFLLVKIIYKFKIRDKVVVNFFNLRNRHINLFVVKGFGGLFWRKPLRLQGRGGDASGCSRKDLQLFEVDGFLHLGMPSLRL